MRLTSTVHYLIQLAALLAQTINALTPALTDREKIVAAAVLAFVQGAVALYAHRVNPDGTPASVAYLPARKLPPLAKLVPLAFLLLLPVLTNAQTMKLQNEIPVGSIVQGQANQQGGGFSVTSQDAWTAGPMAEWWFTFPLPTDLNTSLPCSTNDHKTYFCSLSGLNFTVGTQYFFSETVDATAAQANTNYTVAMEGFYIPGFSVNGHQDASIVLTTIQPAAPPPPPAPFAHWIRLQNVTGYKTGIAVENDTNYSADYSIQLIPKGSPNLAVTMPLGRVAAGDAPDFNLDDYVKNFQGQVNLLGPAASKAVAYVCDQDWQACQVYKP